MKHALDLDPYFDAFDDLTYETICEFFRDVGTERLRLEFKENINPEELARQAVAMANGQGGIIICGFKNPVDNESLTRSNYPIATSELERRRLLSRIQSRVYPSLPIDCAGYTAADNSHALLLVRVESSHAAPHELLNDRGKFIVRRGTEVSGMTLRELELLIRGRDSSPAWTDAIDGRDYAHGSGGMVVFQHGVPERWVGASLTPDDEVSAKPLSRSKQREIERLVVQIENLNDASPVTFTHGILFERDRSVPREDISVDQFALTRWARVAWVGDDGCIEIRLPVSGNDYKAALIQILCATYALGSQLFLEFGISPRGYGSMHLHRGNPPDSEPHQPASGQQRITVNFATDTIGQMCRRPLMYALRGAGLLTDAPDIDAEILKHWQHAYPLLGDLRDRWQ